MVYWVIFTHRMNIHLQGSPQHDRNRTRLSSHYLLAFFPQSHLLWLKSLDEESSDTLPHTPVLLPLLNYPLPPTPPAAHSTPFLPPRWAAAEINTGACFPAVVMLDNRKIKEKMLWENSITHKSHKEPLCDVLFYRNSHIKRAKALWHWRGTFRCLLGTLADRHCFWDLLQNLL